VAELVALAVRVLEAVAERETEALLVAELVALAV
jgi:hypothetical protein